MPEHFKPTADDAALFDRLLRDFVPDNPFDAHGHIYNTAHLRADEMPLIQIGPQVATFNAYRESNTPWMGDKCPTGGLFFPFPHKTCDVDAANQFLIDDLADQPGSRALMLAATVD